jgi:hypothetical protein
VTQFHRALAEIYYGARRCCAQSGTKVMVELADIKKDLPEWPDELIDEWLVYLANREDWPAPGLDDIRLS